MLAIDAHRRIGAECGAFVAFELGAPRELLFAFPNLFEFWFLAVVTIGHFRPGFAWTPRSVYAACVNRAPANVGDDGAWQTWQSNGKPAANAARSRATPSRQSTTVPNTSKTSAFSDVMSHPPDGRQPAYFARRTSPERQAGITDA